MQDYLSSKQAKQVEAIYAMQVYANSKGFPKYYLAHLFNQMYDLEIIEEEAFLQWKDEINENYPNKGQALFYVGNFHLKTNLYKFCLIFHLLLKVATLVHLAAGGARGVQWLGG